MLHGELFTFHHVWRVSSRPLVRQESVTLWKDWIRRLAKPLSPKESALTGVLREMRKVSLRRIQFLSVCLSVCPPVRSIYQPFSCLSNIKFRIRNSY